MEVKFLYNIEGLEKEINQFNDLHKHGNIFHNTNFFYALDKIKTFHPFYIIVMNNSKIEGLLAGYIHSIFSINLIINSRVIIQGSPIILDIPEKKEICNLIISKLNKQLRHKALFIQFRNHFDIQDYNNIFLNNSYKHHSHYNIIQEISNDKNCIEFLNNSKKNQVKKSLANNCKIIHPYELKQIREFYKILKKLYIRIKKPFPPFIFFKTLFEISLKTSICKYFLIEYKNIIIGGALCLVFNKKTIYEWYIGGLNTKFKDVYPSVLATYAIINYAQSNNIAFIDYMGAGKPDKKSGVRDFKLQFGGNLVNFGRFSKINI